MKKTVLRYKNDDEKLVYRINRKTLSGTYHLVGSDRQKQYLKTPIRLDGFAKLPSGFWKEGYGLTAGGNFLVREIFDRYKKKIDLTITATSKSRMDARGRYVTLVLNHKRLSTLNESVRKIKRESNSEIRIEVQHFLGQELPQLRELKDQERGYVSGQLAELLNQPGVYSGMDALDREALEEFIPSYLEHIPGTLRSKKKLQVIYDALDAGKKIYLEKVINEFRSKLKKDVQNESSWQRFLAEYILLLRHNYGEVLEKESVSLRGKFPDFMLVDPYGYLDIYEIKKPSTPLLRYDSSRKNYF